ncbi:MAG: flagellar hook-basal body protein [Desulfobacterales bacterium]|nr:flagellar hook-basal body protein [Desulfobacterales bacterium]
MLFEMFNSVQAGIRQEKKLDLTTNHLANADTNGFKADILSFDEILRAKVTSDFTQGDMKFTENKLDLGLEGRGFFKVKTNDGIRYTRDGNFTLNKEGMLVNHNGFPVLGNGSEIFINGKDVSIGESGEINVDGEFAGNVDVVTFKSFSKIQKKEGLNLYVYNGDPADEISDQSAKVKQGYLERSNISVVSEMTKMIEISRHYEAIQKMIRSIDETDTKALEIARI